MAVAALKNVIARKTAEMTEEEKALIETFSKTMRRMWVQFAKTGNPSLTADISPDGKDHEWPLYDTETKQLMVFEEFNIHPEKESDRKLVDCFYYIWKIRRFYGDFESGI